jgi:hypothetical protein
MLLKKALRTWLLAVQQLKTIERIEIEKMKKMIDSLATSSRPLRPAILSSRQRGKLEDQAAVSAALSATKSHVPSLDFPPLAFVRYAYVGRQRQLRAGRP